MKNYDKPRLASTIVLGIFFLLIASMLIPFVFITLSSLDSNENAAGVIFGAILLIPMMFIVYIIGGVSSAICLGFSINNRKSTLKSVRIISFVMDGLFGSLFIIAVVRLILLFCGV